MKYIYGKKFIHNDNTYSSPDLLSSNYIENLASRHTTQIYNDFKNGDLIKINISVYG